jgi:hypothetical protein
MRSQNRIGAERRRAMLINFIRPGVECSTVERLRNKEGRGNYQRAYGD